MCQNLKDDESINRHSRPSIVKLALTMLVAATLMVVIAMLLRPLFNGADARRLQHGNLQNASELEGNSEGRAECQRAYERLMKRSATSDAERDVTQRNWCLES